MAQWNDEDRKRIGEAFLGVCELHNKTFSEAFARIYLRALESYPANQVVGAFEKSIMKCKFFPKPSELIEMIEGPVEERALLAWTAFREAVRHPGGYTSIMFCDGRISAIIDYFGGWINICNTWLEKEDTFSLRTFSSREAFPIISARTTGRNSQPKPFANG